MDEILLKPNELYYLSKCYSLYSYRGLEEFIQAENTLEALIEKQYAILDENNVLHVEENIEQALNIMDQCMQLISISYIGKQNLGKVLIYTTLKQYTVCIYNHIEDILYLYVGLLENIKEILDTIAFTMTNMNDCNHREEIAISRYKEIINHQYVVKNKDLMTAINRNYYIKIDDVAINEGDELLSHYIFKLGKQSLWRLKKENNNIIFQSFNTKLLSKMLFDMLVRKGLRI